MFGQKHKPVYLQLRHLRLRSVFTYGLSCFVAAFVPSIMIFVFLHFGGFVYADGPERLSGVIIIVFAIGIFILSFVALMIGHLVLAKLLHSLFPLKLSFRGLINGEDVIKTAISNPENKIIQMPLHRFRLRSAFAFGAASLLISFIPVFVFFDSVIFGQDTSSTSTYEVMEFAGRILFFGFLALMIGHFFLTKIFRSNFPLKLFFKAPIAEDDEDQDNPLHPLLRR